MEGRTCNGISLKCIPNQEYRNEVNNLLKENDNYFPYEYYQIKFKTFAVIIVFIGINSIVIV